MAWHADIYAAIFSSVSGERSASIDQLEYFISHVEQTTFRHVTLVSEGGVQMETHKIKDLTVNLFNEVTHLIECQQFVN